MVAELTIISDRGKGVPLFVLTEKGGISAFVERLKELGDTRVIFAECTQVTDNNWNLITDRLQQKLEELSVRQASFIGVGDAATIVQNLALRNIKMMRRLVLIDATTRPHPTWFDRIIDWFESALPLGLPLRTAGKHFDSKALLQRIRCPVLIVTTSGAGERIRHQAGLFNQALPTAWRVDLTAQDEEVQFKSCLLQFYDIPSKRPMSR